MKSEEAISLLGWLKSKTNREDDLEAIDMAIKALQGGGGDLISRADAIDAVVAWTVEDRPTEEMPTDLVDRLNALPSAEAVQGEWGHMIAYGSDGSHWHEYECSHCGEIVLRPYNFCPNCGANMTKGGTE